MFNRNNYPSVPNPFGSRPSRGDGYTTPAQGQNPYPSRSGARVLQDTERHPSIREDRLKCLRGTPLERSP
ncbi:uncharacterized protein An02g08445 [Aspergillus niger]|uniref:Contig An02c0260, genomic contig n=2 Tax=Aspergillus niger TaxID=5061 RepID=A2QDV6_ASPNC|nr:uncharacterized protein An02g08445 [Aspergillus niger]CAK37807.1 unnamed protein product [Aspergillus niger]